MQWGLASTSSRWATESKYPIAFKTGTLAITLTVRNPLENNDVYADTIGVKLCTKTGFYGGLGYTIANDNVFYIAIGV